LLMNPRDVIIGMLIAGLVIMLTIAVAKAGQ
jgi:hypothetical protein